MLWSYFHSTHGWMCRKGPMYVWVWVCFRVNASRLCLDLETTHANVCCTCLPIAFQMGRANAILKPHATLGKVPNGIPSSRFPHVRCTIHCVRVCNSCLCVYVFVCVCRVHACPPQGTLVSSFYYFGIVANKKDCLNDFRIVANNSDLDTHTLSHTLAHTRTCTHTDTHTYTHICAHTYTHTCACTHIHTHKHTHTHMCTYTQAQARNRRNICKL